LERDLAAPRPRGHHSIEIVLERPAAIGVESDDVIIQDSGIFLTNEIARGDCCVDLPLLFARSALQLEATHHHWPDFGFTVQPLKDCSTSTAKPWHARTSSFFHHKVENSAEILS